MITLMEETGDNTHRGDIMITLVGYTGDNTHGGDR